MSLCIFALADRRMLVQILHNLLLQYIHIENIVKTVFHLLHPIKSCLDREVVFSVLKPAFFLKKITSQRIITAAFTSTKNSL